VKNLSATCLVPLALLSSLVLALLPGCSSEPEPSFLEDRAHLLTRTEKEHLTAYNEALLRDLDVHFKLIILAEEALDINILAAEIFADLGKKTSGARGLLYLVDPVGGQVRIEVGFDLEPVFPDAFVGYLERRQMAPFFSAGKVGNGIEATTELFVTRIRNSIEGRECDPQKELPDPGHFSGGGGARIKTVIGATAPVKVKIAAGQRYQPQAMPEQTLALYGASLQAHVKDPDLPLFTPATRKFFATRLVTDGQQDNELRSLKSAPQSEVLTSGHYAVLRYAFRERLYSPYFFTKGENGWMLDFATMSRVLQMNHKNMWMMKRTDHPYMFAFSDWKFDAGGFPVGEK